MSTSLDFSFYEYLKYYYKHNKGKIHRNYKSLTKKFLDYNDKEINPNAFLRKPQFEALEMYVFFKEFFDNAQVYEVFEDWKNKQGNFSDDSYYSLNKTQPSGQLQVDMYDVQAEEVKDYYKRLKKVRMEYPNYIYALTMGLGKTILMATSIFYEFLLASKYPQDKRFCHNTLVFAPDKTVLESLREIMTLDKIKIIPPEYVNILDSNIKFHFLEDTGTVLSTIDDSDFNIVISNTQKIIVKKKRKEDTATNKFFNISNKETSSVLSSALKDIYGDSDIGSEEDLIINQRFTKLCRLPQLGIYVDEAHHMFGNTLNKELYDQSKDTSLRSTINFFSKELKRQNSRLVACYNYTGTPYVKNMILPEVVYSYGLSESISKGYLKKANRIGYENVKNVEFLKSVIKDFWNKYGGKTYEGLAPKLAIFSSLQKELINDVAPIVEEVLTELGVSTSKILINIGDPKNTKPEDIRNFNNLDVHGTIGSEKQFILLVDKGREGWNCRSLFGVALFREPKSKIFVLQATMRCLRKITETQQEATIYLSKQNMDILEEELKQNFRSSLDDLKGSTENNKKLYQVRLVPPERYIYLKEVKHVYSIEENENKESISFELDSLDLEKYKVTIYRQESMTLGLTTKKYNADYLRDNIIYSELMLVSEISRYINFSCIEINKILNQSSEGIDIIIEYINRYNDILYDVIIPKIFNSMYEVKYKIMSEDKKISLLREPNNSGYYEFNAKPELVKKSDDSDMEVYQNKSFHADTYCFDSKPEKECFLQYLKSDLVKEIFFTGMFTGDQGDLAIQYYDPVSGRIRNYYPDFFAKMKDGSYQIIEVKGDNKMDDEVVIAKANAARELANESNVEYKLYMGSLIMNSNILEEDKSSNKTQILIT